MVKKIITAVISTIIFSVLMGTINYLTFPVTTSDAFWEPVLFFLLYSAPIYLIAGIAFSSLIDKLMRRINFTSSISRHYTRYGLYILIGIVGATVYKLIMVGTEGTPFTEGYFLFLVGGVLASLIFYYVSLVIDRNNA